MPPPRPHQIVVHNSGPDGSLRGACAALGKPSGTIEIGDPQSLHLPFIDAAYAGVLNTLAHLKLGGVSGGADEVPPDREPTVCARSQWIFTETGGVMHVRPDVNSWVRRGDLVAEIFSVFGVLVDRVLAPCDGVVVGKSTVRPRSTPLPPVAGVCARSSAPCCLPHTMLPTPPSPPPHAMQNPVAQSGDRVLHLGIVEPVFPRGKAEDGHM